MYFSYRYYKCYLLLTDLTWIGVSLGAVIAYLTLTITSVLILIVARRSATRHGERLRWMGVATVILTVGLYQLSQLPMTVVIISHYVLGVEPSSTTFRASMQVTHLNIMANFFVYALTVRSFRTFLKLKMTFLLSFLRMSRRPRGAPIRCEDLPLKKAVSKKEGEASLTPLSAAKPLGLHTAIPFHVSRMDQSNQTTQSSSCCLSALVFSVLLFSFDKLQLTPFYFVDS